MFYTCLCLEFGTQELRILDYVYDTWAQRIHYSHIPGSYSWLGYSASAIESKALSGPSPLVFQFTKYASSSFSRVAHSKITKKKKKTGKSRGKIKKKTENSKRKKGNEIKNGNRQKRKVNTVCRGYNTLTSDSMV